MPRTRITKATKAKQTLKINEKLENSDSPSKNEMCASLLNNLHKETNNKRLEMGNYFKSVLDQIETVCFEQLALIDASEGNKTLAELRAEKSSDCLSLISNSSSILKSAMFKTFNTTKINKSTTVKKKKKLTDDEGYITAGDTRRTASCDRTRLSRSTTRTIVKSTKRMSRSLSKTKLPKNVTIQAPFKNTPKKLIPSMSFGFVTPKVKPNTTLTVLRHPKQGEMAISMQGSPLVVGNVITDACANVNIPLQDGRILSLQPSRSLRQSEIPDLDDFMRQQLRTLSENLNKVVKMANQC